MKLIDKFILFIALLSMFSCKKQIEKQFNEYIFLGHTYRWYSHSKVDSRIEKVNFEQYDKILLGGDICVESSAEYSTLRYLDRLFDLSSENTHWAIGNHDVDNGNPDWISEFTKRPLFYAVYTEGFTLFNLDTQLDYTLRNEQFDLFSHVCDTIKESSHLIVMMHHVVWDSISTEFDGNDFANGNFPHWHARKDPFDYFYHSMYPQLVNVQNKDVQVICISGDVGQRETKFFEYKSIEGIQFLASGINNSVESDSDEAAKLPADHCLVLEHDTIQNTITWKFYNLDEFIK